MHTSVWGHNIQSYKSQEQKAVTELYKLGNKKQDISLGTTVSLAKCCMKPRSSKKKFVLDLYEF